MTVARIIVKRPGGFTGHIGSTAFAKGEGETSEATAVAYFKRHPDRFEVVEDEPAGDPKDDGSEPGPEADAYDDLTDEQVAEAYATNVAGNATTRKGQLKALRKLEADAAENDPEDPEDPESGDGDDDTQE